MRNRYFSPESIHYSANLQANPTNNSGRLKWAGSTSKLHSYNSILLSDSERKIGSYFYDVAKEIGSGYSSKVFKGRSSKDDSDCAVKVIELKKYSESSLKMLDSEIEILKTLDHPNVIKCLDVYKTATHCFIIN
jgi:serine/threonine protein kinase